MVSGLRKRKTELENENRELKAKLQRIQDGTLESMNAASEVGDLGPDSACNGFVEESETIIFCPISETAPETEISCEDHSEEFISYEPAPEMAVVAPGDPRKRDPEITSSRADIMEQTEMVLLSNASEVTTETGRETSIPGRDCLEGRPTHTCSSPSPAESILRAELPSAGNTPSPLHTSSATDLCASIHQVPSIANTGALDLPLAGISSD